MTVAGPASSADFDDHAEDFKRGIAFLSNSTVRVPPDAVIIASRNIASGLGAAVGDKLAAGFGVRRRPLSATTLQVTRRTLVA